MTPAGGLTTLADVGTPSNPFPGLRPFEFGESHLYFGREGQSDQLIRKLSATRFVAVVGTSGSGKSSLVRAGLLPDLFSGFMPGAGSHWRVCLMRPSNDPLGNLARALNSTEVFGSEIEENAEVQTAITEATLRRGGLGLVEAVRQNRMASNESLLVVVDQFEELFRFARVSGSEQYRYEAAAFVKLLLEAARQREQNVYVALTMRSDFLGDCSIFWDLPEAINEGQYLIPRMTRDQRAEAITGPIAVCGGQVAQRLINRLLNDTGDNPDMLPILQHALMRTWENWAADHAAGEPVDLRHYEAVGTMSDALSRHADEAWSELSDERSRQIAERVFKALTEKGEDNREVRRPTVLRDLCEQVGATLPEVATVVEIFRRDGRSFLMPPAAVPLDEESLIDISHESLIRNWQRLKEWVDEEAQSAQIYRRLAETAALWNESREGFLQDPALQITLDWREKSEPNAAWAQRYDPEFGPAMSFLDTSVAARHADALEGEQRRRREIRRTRVAAVVFFLLFMLSLGALVFAYTKTLQAQEALGRAEEYNRQAVAERATAVRERDRANAQTEVARRNEEAADSAKVIAEKKKKEAEESKVEAVKSAEVARLNAHRAEVSRLEAESQRVEVERQKKSIEVAATRNSQLLYASEMTLAQQAYDASNVARARELLFAHKPGDGGARAGFEWQYLWHLLNREQGSLSYFNKFSTLALTPDGRTLAVGRGGAAVLWDVAANRSLGSIPAGARALSALALSPDGRHLALSGVGTNVVTLVETASPDKSEKLGDGQAEIAALAFSSDSRTLALGYEDNAEFWDVASRQKKEGFNYTRQLGSAVSSIAFMPNGNKVAVGTVKGRLYVWDIVRGGPPCAPGSSENGNSVNTLAFSRDGGTIAVGRKDGSVKLVSAATCGPLDTAETPLLDAGISPVRAVAFSPNRELLAAGYEDGSIELVDVGRRQKSVTLKGHGEAVNSVFFSPEGQLMSGSNEGAIKLWDAAALALEAKPLEGHTGQVNAVAFSPDGRTLATGGNDKAVLLWDVETHRKLDAPALTYKGRVNSIAFAPNSRALLVGADDPPLSIWDAGVVGAMPQPLAGSSPVRAVAYTPDGKYIVVGDNKGPDHFLSLWDAGNRRLIKEQEFFERTILSVAVSHDGKTVAVGLGDGGVEVWDTALTKSLFQFPNDAGSANPVNSVAFSPDGSMLAAGLSGGEVKLLALGGGGEVTRLRGHNGEVFAVAFSPDGATLATGGNDATIRLWATSSFKELITLDGHKGAVMSLAFSPDGQTLASASFDRTVRLWRTSAVGAKAAGR